MTDNNYRTDGGEGENGDASGGESRVREAHLSGDDLTAYVCTNGHATFPGHQRCPECGEVQTTTLDLSDARAEVVTWTTSTATPPGVREPNHLAFVEFDLDAALDAASGFTPGTVEGPVRTLAQLTTSDVESGDVVEPTYVDELREPGAGIREPDSQSWDGYRFRPVED
jgi:uncharacterized OB-fold protein